MSKIDLYQTVAKYIKARSMSMSLDVKYNDMGLLSDIGHARVVMHVGIIKPVVSFEVETYQRSRRMRNPRFFDFSIHF